jgi:two-component system OmpR family response regulator
MSQQQRLNVLVIDPDEETNLRIKSLLSEEGYQVSTITDPAGASEEVRSNRHQLVIVDVSPENEPGLEALRMLRSSDSDLCIVATTDFPTVEMAVSAMKQQAFNYLRKPIDAGELRAVLREAIMEKGLLVDLEMRLNLEVGRRIRERRHSRPLTLKQLANRTGLSVSLISQIELGKSAASMSTLHKLATALGTKMTYFFETV